MKHSAPATSGATFTAPLATDGTLGDLFRQTQASLAALQQMQEQTARLHAQYLQGQEAATRAFQQLVEQQERLFERATGGESAPRERSNFESIPAARNRTEPSITAAAQPEAVHSEAAPGLDLAELLLEVVAEKTGYPRETLEPGMALDADLGIDSIKRVEILSALQERAPQLPTLAAEELGGIQTLSDIVRLLAEKGGASLSTVPAPAGAAPLEALLLEIVAEKTGYPAEMLGLNMALDADLGIDSIKRVEILSALQERLPNLPTLAADELGAIHTLRDIVAKLATGASAPAAQARPAPLAAPSQSIEDLLLAVVAEKTGYPADMLGLDMALDADLGIDSIKRVEILSTLQERVPGLPTVEAEALASLVTLRDVARAMSTAPAPAPAKKTEAPSRIPAAPVVVATPSRVFAQSLDRVALAPSAKRRASGAPPRGNVLVHGASDEFFAAFASAMKGHGLETLPFDPARVKTAAGLVVLAPDAPDADWARSAFDAVKAFSPGARGATGGFIACVTRLDGAFGLRRPALAAQPETGALAGLAKTAAREWPGMKVRAIDLATDFASLDSAAAALAEEILADGPLETGLAPEGPSTLELKPHTHSPGGCNAVALTPQDVIVITGGARGVTAALAEAMARSGRPKLALLGRSALLVAEPEWLAAARDERAIKRALAEHAETKLAPQELERRYRELAAAREVNETLRRIGAAGAQARYYAADVRDAAQLRGVAERVRADLGPITGLVHGAGVLADRRIEDKTPDQFDAVYGTKVDGLRNLLGETAADPLRFISIFSSSTARFGRVGQVDYAMANEALNKMARAEAARRERCRVLSINWGPWDGGMVTPALRKIFAAEGVGVIGLEEGARFLLEELACGGDAVELVALAEAASESALAPAGAMNAALTMELTPERFPFLASHVIDGHAVLPVAMYVEWLAHAAVHANPGLRFVGIEDLRVLNGVVLDTGAPLALEIAAGTAIGEDGCKRVAVEMRGTGPGGRRVLHSTAIVLLDASFGASGTTLGARALPPYRGSRDEIYNHHKLFHGPLFQGLLTVDGCGEEGISVTASAAPAPETWIRSPLRRRWLADPLALDCAFQAMILWSLDRFDTASLPVRLGKYEQFQTAFPKSGVRIEARVSKSTPFGATATIEFLHPVDGTLVARIEDYECVMAASLNAAFQRNQIAQPARD